MYQVTFSEQAMRELNRLDKLAQLDAIDPISSLKPTDLAHPREPLGHYRRGQMSLFRLRAGDFRFYFEKRGETLHVDGGTHAAGGWYRDPADGAWTLGPPRAR